MDKIKINKKEAEKYLKENNLLKYLQKSARGQIKPDFCDLARLHRFAVNRKSFTILEFGVGYSTIVLADALRLNKERWGKLKDKKDLRVKYPFKLFSVDSSKKWINIAYKLMPSELKNYIDISYSEVNTGLFNNRMCHFYQNIPDIVPDFIYLDGPDPATVKGDINGMTWQNQERTVMSGDILIMEPTLLPGTFVIIDGRVNNTRFLENNLQRKWDIKYNENADITLMELTEKPLGKINREIIKYCFKNK